MIHLPIKDFLGISELSLSSIISILDRARLLKNEALSGANNPSPSAGLLQDKTVVLLFIEPSTRTRTSFEKAALQLGAKVIYLDPEASSLKKGETLLDMALNLDAIGADAIILRHYASGAAHFLAKRVRASVINAGDGAHEHPTQALLDTFTLLEKWPSQTDLKSKHILILGDIRFSRVARSNLLIFKKLGARVTVAGPPTLVPHAFENLGAEVAHSLDEKLLSSVDAIYALRIQKERAATGYFPSIEEYNASFGLTQKLLKACKPNLLILHPGPINRGIELTSEVADGKHSMILNQVANGVFVRMAVLEAAVASQVNGVKSR